VRSQGLPRIAEKARHTPQISQQFTELMALIFAVALHGGMLGPRGSRKANGRRR
jgi:hypothetical protein